VRILAVATVALLTCRFFQDLLKGIQNYAASFYKSRGLMKTNKKVRDEKGQKMPSMIQKLDGSALVALGRLESSSA